MFWAAAASQQAGETVMIIWVACWLPILGALVLLLVWLLGIGTAEVAGYRRARGTASV